MPNYESIFQCDRSGRIGGGVLVAVKNGIQVTCRHDLEPNNMELVVTEIMKSNKKPVILCTFYHPSNSKPNVLQQLNDSIQNNPESSRIIVVGDFNLPSVRWLLYENTHINIAGSHENETFCDLVDDKLYGNLNLALPILLVKKLDLLLCN